MNAERHCSAIQPIALKEPSQRGSSQSLPRVQPKMIPDRRSVHVFFLFLTLSACATNPFHEIQGEWRLDLSAMQHTLNDATHARPQAKAAAILSASLLKRYRFTFQGETLAFGHDHKMRTVALEYVRTEKKSRLVFRVSDSPFLLRLTPKAGTLVLDFEDQVWHLEKR